MAKKKADNITEKVYDLEAIAKHTSDKKIVDTLRENYMPYAMSVIVSRAIPEIDGLKPSHRKLLYTMYKMGLLNGGLTKSANIVGQTMKLNPHGDQAIYETMVRLTTGNESLLHPLILSKGNFGKKYSRDMSYAASRYTEAKLDKICEVIFGNIDKNAVDFVDNYDGTMKEPKLLPVAFPNILVNPNQGIAVGMASNFCSFNLREICDATIAIIKNKELTTEELMEILISPDFTTGGQLIIKKDDIKNIYENGRGSFKVRSRYTYDKKNSLIEITEIPYSTTSEAIMDAIAAGVKAGKLKEILDMRDETDLKGLKITLEIRKSVDPDALMTKLYQLTPLEDSFSCNFNLLIDGKPKVLGVRSIIDEWLLFRIDCIKRYTLFDISKLKDKLHLLEGLREILLDIDKAIKIVRETEDDNMVVPNLMVGFNIDEIQAEYVADIKLRNLNKQFIINRISEIEAITEEISRLEALYNSNTKIKNLIAKQLADIAKKYGQDRKTDVINETEIEVLSKDDMIEDFNLKIFISDHGYFKKIPLTSLRSNPEQKTKDDDFIAQEIETHNKADILFFSSKANCYKAKLYDLPEHKPSSLGDYLNNLLNMEEDESIEYVLVTDNYEGYMLFAFENGKIAKIPLKAYETKTNRKRLTNAYSEKFPLAEILYVPEDCKLAAFSSINKVLVFNTAMLNPISSRTSQGVQVLKAKKGSVLAAVMPLERAGLTNVEYYTALKIPGIGTYLREQDIEDTQIKLDL